jgi:hypothetical protein
LLIAGLTRLLEYVKAELEINVDQVIFFSPFVPMWNIGPLVLSKASPFASFQLIPTFCSSLSVLLFQVVLG